MNFLFSEFFWGSALILFGLSLILKVLLGIDIPILRLFMGGLVIYAGLSFILGQGFSCYKKHTIIFNKSRLKPENINKLTTAFSDTVLDLSNLNITNTETVKINTLFGQTVIKLDKTIPTEIIVNASFANATLPNNNSISFGSLRYKTSDNLKESPRLILEASVVFGNLEILEI
jgi:hypothetical protein